MNNTPLISIIVNCFNGEKYLQKALQSIIDQTYQNWEVILWDNKSTDGSKKIFLSYKEKRFKYFFSGKHVPLYNARNQAIEVSHGKIIAFLDTDDWWDEKKLEKQVALFSDDKVGLVYSNCNLFYEDSNTIKLFKRKKLKSGYITKELFKSYDVGILTVLIRRSAYNDILGFNNKYSIIGDFDLVIRLSCSWKFACLQEPLAYYRIHNQNFSSTSGSLEVDELQDWLLDDNITSNKNLKFYLSFVRQRILYLKTVSLINNKKILKALKNIIIYPMGFRKFKLLLYIILPKKILKKIKNFK
jgi:glycosyltransferase involved in cell wall biosynthesis